jgi:hypothetical protein
VSLGWLSPSSRGLLGGNALLISTGAAGNRNPLVFGQDEVSLVWSVAGLALGSHVRGCGGGGGGFEQRRRSGTHSR